MENGRGGIIDGCFGCGHARAIPVMLLALNKPYDVLSQFTPDCPGQRTLAEFGFGRGVYGIGRLDRDSEGLLLLSDDPVWTDRLLNPRHAHPRLYHVQVEGVPRPEQLAELERGVTIQGHRTGRATARALVPAPPWPPRVPPIRVRKTVPDSWISLELMEGKNRQVRRMTAAVGLPTLRLIRVRIGRLDLLDLGLAPGQWRALTRAETAAALAQAPVA
jgi:23S rRNA pseudouridine2457 synthase